MMNKRFLLKEENDIEPIVIDEPIEPVVAEVEVPVEEPKPEVVTTAYMDMLQDVLRKQWDVINACDGLVASLSMDESVPFTKEDVSSILKKIVEDTTVAIGMTTKAISTIDPKQEELMTAGEEKAEEVIKEPAMEESLEEDKKVLTEELTVDLSDLEYYDRYWAEEALYQLEYIMDNIEDYDDEDWATFLPDMNPRDIRDICESVANDVRNSDWLWEQISETIQDNLHEAINDKIEEIKGRSTTEIGKPEGEEGE